jgi:hypothetical protein
MGANGGHAAPVRKQQQPAPNTKHTATRTELLRRGVWAVIISVGVAIAATLIVNIHPGHEGDYVQYFEPATRAFLAGDSPYSVDDVFNPPWTFILFAPLTLFAPLFASALMQIASFALIIVLCRADVIRTVLVVTFPPVMGSILAVNFDLLLLPALWMPPQLGVLLLATKPQFGMGLIAYWFLKGRGLWTLVMAFGLATLLYGPWWATAGTAIDFRWNASIWPVIGMVPALAIGVTWWGFAWRAGRPDWALGASVWFAPYLGVGSYAAMLPLLLQSRVLLFVVYVITWAVWTTQILDIP